MAPPHASPVASLARARPLSLTLIGESEAVVELVVKINEVDIPVPLPVALCHFQRHPARVPTMDS